MLKETTKGVSENNLKFFNEITLVEMAKFREKVAANQELSQKNEDFQRLSDENMAKIHILDVKSNQV